MKFHPDELDRMAAVLQARTESFTELVRIAALDPAHDLIGGDLRGVNFRSDDITGFNFARADLSGANFSRAHGMDAFMFAGAVWDSSTSWPSGFQPATDAPDVSWADAWGTDSFGVWASFSVPAAGGSRVTQRLRLCPQGRFLMGSTANEEGRWREEGPRHEVRLAAGFWLFDTPCTQALWEAVMGGNPSRFRSPTRPVEWVGFEDARAFLAKVNTLVPSLGLVLPSEAQWEYACRAGTGTATYAGELHILGEHNGPVLDGIAWYGGNSGVGFELLNGVDSSGWKEKQHAHTRAGTRHPTSG